MQNPEDPKNLSEQPPEDLSRRIQIRGDECAFSVSDSVSDEQMKLLQQIADDYLVPPQLRFDGDGNMFVWFGIDEPEGPTMQKIDRDGKLVRGYGWIMDDDSITIPIDFEEFVNDTYDHQNLGSYPNDTPPEQLRTLKTLFPWWDSLTPPGWDILANSDQNKTAESSRGAVEDSDQVELEEDRWPSD